MNNLLKFFPFLPEAKNVGKLVLALLFYGYLPIAENSLLHRILFVDFNLAWVFYLPSQVLISLSSVHTKK